MKRLISVILIIGIFMGLCGCERYSDYEEPENRLFISALGIDAEEDKIKVFAEAAETNHTTGGYKVTVLKGEGKTILEALRSLDDTRPLKTDLSHCTVIAVGKRSDGTEKKLAEYLLSKTEDMLSVYIVACNSAEKLLSCGNGEKQMGYELSHALKEDIYAGYNGTPCTLLDIINQAPTFSLPYFNASGKDKNAEYVYSGTVIYNGTERVAQKDADESRIINLISGRFLRGKLTVADTTLEITKAESKAVITDNEIALNVALNLKGDADKAALKAEILSVLNEFKDMGYNIFNFTKNGKKLTGTEFNNKNIDVTLELKGEA